MKKMLFSLFLGLICCFQCIAFCGNSKLDEDFWHAYHKDSIALIEENALILGDTEYTECHLYLAENYYFDEKCYRKAMYWAISGAELGSSDCMLLLRKAYAEGLGAIPDTEESLKWLMLAAAIGNKEAQKDVKKLEFLDFSYSTLPNNEIKLISKEHETRWNEAKKRANSWIKTHQSLFLSQH